VVLAASTEVSCARTAAPRTPDVPTGYEFPAASPPNSDRLFLVLTFSGGGVRATALSLGALEQMVEDSVCVDGRKKSVADEIDIISAVSGGSFTAAQYALYGRAGLPALADNFLYARSQSELALRWFTPEKLLHILASPRYGRTDVAAEVWDDLLFHHHTLGDLAARGRPYVYINATDMDASSVFSFTGEQLRALCIAADTFSIARAVAASSAVPGALSPMTLRNHAAGNPCVPPPAWTIDALRADKASERYQYASTLASYAERRRQYVHLLDGGLVDNTGARVPLRLLKNSGEQGSILDRLERRATSTVLFVAVDAQVAGDKTLGRSGESPSVPKALSRGADIALANTSRDILRLLRNEIASANERYAPGHADTDCAPLSNGAPILCMAEVVFRNVPDDSTRARLDRISTAFQLGRRDVDLLRTTARTLLRAQPAYRSLLDRYACRS